MLYHFAILIPYRTDKDRGPEVSPILASVVNFRVGIGDPLYKRRTLAQYRPDQHRVLIGTTGAKNQTWISE